MRPPRPEDAEELYGAVCSRPEVTRFLTWHPHADVRTTEDVITSILEKNAAGGERTWLITRDGSIVGMLTCWSDDGVRLGYCLSPEVWGQGLMAVTLDLLLRELAAVQGPAALRVWATTDAEHWRSQRTLQRAGFMRVGALPGHAVHPALGEDPRPSALFERNLPERP